MRVAFVLFLLSMVGALGDFDQIPAPPGTEEKFSGIGAVLAKQPGGPVVQSLLPDSPAGEGWVGCGDIILQVDGKKTDGMVLADVVDKIRGPEGSKVHLVVQRAGKPGTLSFDVVRKSLSVQTPPAMF